MQHTVTAMILTSGDPQVHVDSGVKEYTVQNPAGCSMNLGPCVKPFIALEPNFDNEPDENALVPQVNESSHATTSGVIPAQQLGVHVNIPSVHAKR